MPIQNPANWLRISALVLPFLAACDGDPTVPAAAADRGVWGSAGVEIHVIPDGFQLAPEQGNMLNKRGDVAGTLIVDGLPVPAYYLHGTGVTRVEIPAGMQGSATGISENGIVVGYFGETPDVHRAFIVRDGQLTRLGTLGGSWSRARAVNSSGVVVGSSLTASGEQHAFMYRDGVMTDLGTLGGPTSVAIDISEGGEVTGVAEASRYDHRAFRFSGEQLNALPTPAVSLGMAINEAGDIGGEVNYTSNNHAMIVAGGETIDLGAFFGVYSTVFGLDDAAEILVGNAIFGPELVRWGAVWLKTPNDYYRGYFLNDLVNGGPGRSSWSFSGGRSVSADGRFIVAESYRDGPVVVVLEDAGR